MRRLTTDTAEEAANARCIRARSLSARSASTVSILALAGALLVLAGCGGSSSGGYPNAAPAATSGSASAGQQSLSLTADPGGQLKYNTTSLTAKSGKVAIDFTNMAPESHNVTIASAAGAVVGATPTFQGSSKTLSIDLKPGTYTFYCSVPGHRAGGMEGTLTVK